jgi:hypothetical protein
MDGFCNERRDPELGEASQGPSQPLSDATIVGTFHTTREIKFKTK